MAAELKCSYPVFSIPRKRGNRSQAAQERRFARGQWLRKEDPAYWRRAEEADRQDNSLHEPASSSSGNILCLAAKWKARPKSLSTSSAVTEPARKRKRTRRSTSVLHEAVRKQSTLSAKALREANQLAAVFDQAYQEWKGSDFRSRVAIKRRVGLQVPRGSVGQWLLDQRIGSACSTCRDRQPAVRGHKGLVLNTKP